MHTYDHASNNTCCHVGLRKEITTGKPSLLQAEFSVDVLDFLLLFTAHLRLHEHQLLSVETGSHNSEGHLQEVWGGSCSERARGNIFVWAAGGSVKSDSCLQTENIMSHEEAGPKASPLSTRRAIISPRS